MVILRFIHLIHTFSRLLVVSISRPQEMYRRWVCSTFIPYFATRNDIKSDPQPVTLADTDAALSNSNLLNNIDNKAQKMFKQTHSLEGSNEIKRWVLAVRREEVRTNQPPLFQIAKKSSTRTEAHPNTTVSKRVSNRRTKVSIHAACWSCTGLSNAICWRANISVSR